MTFFTDLAAQLVKLCWSSGHLVVFAAECCETWHNDWDHMQRPTRQEGPC